MIWLTSDLHLGHANIMRHCNRPFETVEQMDGALIGAINARVCPGDTLYVLGDFSMHGKLDKVLAYRARINCDDVRLVRGNHDKHFDDLEKPPFAEEADYLELKHEGRRVCCMHYPLLAWHGMEGGALMLHGHIHATEEYNLQNLERGILRYDVGVDANGYAPVTLDEVLRFFDGVEPSEEHHWKDGDH